MEEKKTRSPKHTAPETGRHASRAARETSRHAAGAANRRTEKETPAADRRAVRRRKMATPFFAVLFSLALIALIIPLRPTESMREKRRLAEFPKLTAQTLLNGDFFDGVSTWYSDTFPGREVWLDVATGMNNLHGITTNVIDYSQLKADASGGEEEYLPLPTPEPTPAAAEETPDAEAEPTPTPEPTPVPTPEPTPYYEEIDTPTESVETWGGLGDNDEKVIHGAALQIGGAAFEKFTFNEGLTTLNANMVSRAAGIAKEYDVRFFDMPIPASVGVLLSSDLLDRLGMDDQGKAIAFKFEKESDDVIKVNVFNTLIRHNSEYIYFRTDHHWTALGAYYAYETFCRMADFEPVPLEEFTELDMGRSLGSFYSTSPAPAKLEEDELYAYSPPGDIEMDVYKNGTHFSAEPIIDMSQSSIFSKYMAFLGGDHTMTVLTNNDLPDAPNCVVYKDSYGNPFVLYLTQHYHRVYALDFRQYDAMGMRSFIQAYHINDVILAESMSKAMGYGAYEQLDMRLGY
ncbi:MAG: hypothetical protein IJS79_06595 [Oscillospiraceae bacterium]|nr:hypothetical protein [Oscillospiraceae bacterium]